MNAFDLRSRLTRKSAAGVLLAFARLVLVAAFLLCAMALPAMALAGCPLESDPDPECTCVGELVHGCPCTSESTAQHATLAPSVETGK